MRHIITYQKNNGDLIYRERTSLPETKIGDTTSMGWKVIDIHYEYDGNFLHYAEFIKALRSSRIPLKKRIILSLVRRLNKLVR